VLKEIVEVELNRRTVMRLEKMESDGPAQPGGHSALLSTMTTREQNKQITAFQKTTA